MSSRVNGANRATLTLLGLLLLAAGVLGLVLGLGGFGSDRVSSPVLPAQLRTFATETWWFWPAVAVGCLLLALLGLRWLLAQLRTDRVGRLDLTDDDRNGVTTLHGGAVTSAVEDEAESIRGVAGATARLRGEQTRRMDLTVDLTDYADIAEVRTRLEDRLVPHLRQALDDPDFPVGIELRPAARARAAERGLT